MKRISATALIALSAIALGISACGNDPDARSEGRYCTEVGDHLTALNSPVLTTGADVDATMEAWRTVARSAPLAIEKEWTIMLASMETASTVDPADPASMQKVADTARASEPYANRVIEYTYSLCQALIGSVTPVSTAPATAPDTTPSTTGG